MSCSDLYRVDHKFLLSPCGIPFRESELLARLNDDDDDNIPMWKISSLRDLTAKVLDRGLEVREF